MQNPTDTQRTLEVSQMPTPPATIHDVLDQFRAEARSNRDLGDRFERLICRYLELDPLYNDRFSRIWMWNDRPSKGHVGDVGIDIVAQERATGDYCAIQCKFYLPEHTLAKEDIDSFFTAAGKEPFTSCMIVATTDKWGSNAEHALKNQSKPVTRLRVEDLDASPIDWSRFSLKKPQNLQLRARKPIREHQKAALEDAISGLATVDRGKLIMACGTGKTYTALRIAETMASGGHVLFLVPSLSLLSQALREWTAETTHTIHSLAVCSDANIGKRKVDDDDNTDIFTYDLAFPASTSARDITRQYKAIQAKATANAPTPQLTVVFSTYQSIKAVSDAQKAGLPEFDLIICDEAHRTTGVTLSGEDESEFVKIHDSDFIRGKKRIYMTATPRLYGDDAKAKAMEASAEICSMDDPAKFGPELHRLGFGESVSKGLLSDYKVLVLAVDEKYVSKTFQKLIADADNELRLDDAVRIIGCWNGLAKRLKGTTATAVDLQGDTQHMRRAVAFSRSIKDSKSFVEKFGQIIQTYRDSHPEQIDLLDCELAHVDGTFDALKRNARLDWLKAKVPENTCRILSNARCLSEGVDVPALDAVLFLNPRNSVIDVVQSVGRVMRRSIAKEYGYIILPIGIPGDIAPEEALKNNERYKIVWQVLQALRAHDDRFNATINRIELNTERPDNIQVIGVGGGHEESEGSSDGDGKPRITEHQVTFAFPTLDEWKDAIFAKIVIKCGDRRYWESWAKDVAVIADHHTTRIRTVLEGSEARHKTAFAQFLGGLRQNLNPEISEDDAIEMLSQHLITRPVFDALFENYAFTKHNPVSIAMQTTLDVLEDQAMEKEVVSLEKFYASVRDRASGIDNAEAKQVRRMILTKFVSARTSLRRRRLYATPRDLSDRSGNQGTGRPVRRWSRTACWR
jgi:predicted helicase